MKTCPVCGFHHEDKDKRCVRCKAPLDAEVTPEDEAFVQRTAAKLERRSFRMPDLGGFLGRIALKLGIRHWFDFPLPEGVHHRNPWKAGFLSLIPGGGQLYNFQLKKAIYFIIAFAIAVAIVATTWYEPYNHYLLGLFVLWSAFAFHDGLQTAIRINRQYWTTRLSVAAYCAWLFEIALVAIFAQYISSMFFIKFRYIHDNALAPTIQRGDRLGIDILSYWIRKPRVGDIIYYDPKRIAIERGEDLYIVDSQNGIERIVAGPGQTFAHHDGKFYLDGVELPPERSPLVHKLVTKSYELRAPPGHYIVILSYVPEDALDIKNIDNVENWREACLVSKKDMIGRVWFIYHPPPRRRLLTPEPLPDAKNPAS